MARHSIDIKELKRDAFREKAFELIDYVYRHGTWAVGIAAALVIGVGLVFAYFAYLGYAASKQAEGFYAVERIMNDPKLGDEERDKKTKEALGVFLSDNPDSGLSPSAWMYLAQISWRLKDMEGAKRAFRKAREHDRSHPSTRQLALIGEAKLHEAEGDFEASEKIFKALPGENFADLKAFNLGRLALIGDRREDAKREFEKVLQQEPRSPLARWADDALDAFPAPAK